MSDRPASTVPAMLDALRDRCAALSLPVWRCDTAGTIVAEPVETGLAGLWLRSSSITAVVAGAAREWASHSLAQPRAAFPGAWLIPVVHETRRRRTGVSIALALSPGALSAQVFTEACAGAGLDEHAVRLSLRKMAVYDEAGVSRSASTLNWMVNDLTALADHTDAVHGFTHELTQSYETIDLLYALGRSMLDLHHPDRFITRLCERLHETLPFGWLACQFADDPRLAGPLAGRLISRGSLPAGTETIRDAFARLSKNPSDPRGYLAPSVKGPASEARAVCQPISFDGKLAGVIVCGDKLGEDPQVSSYDIQLIEAAAGFAGAFLENARLVANLQAMFMGTLRALTAAIDAKDRYTCGHSERVAHLASKLALATGMDHAAAERIHICGLVHDVGKIGVPEAVLCKPGRLTDEEFALVRRHPEIGFGIMKDIPMLEDVLPGVLHHHERFDGRGYPRGLAGKDIPLFARILGIVDTFDAMSSNRAYRPPMPRDRVIAEIARCAGTQFDPDLAHAFLELTFQEYDAMVARHAEEYGPQRIVAAAA